ncbi:MAG: T9SS type A sorting domain-containing protein [Sinomicrobium sp.]|nr:T9SS type A sorting domain-containing protein [Sinomicrobium sp.]
MKKYYMVIFISLLFISGMVPQPSGKYGGGSNDGFAFSESAGNVLSVKHHYVDGTSLVHPNPVVKNNAGVYFNSALKGDIAIKWYDLRSALIHTETLRKSEVEIRLTLPVLTSGVYILSIEKDNKNMYSEKVVMQ